MSTLGSHRVTDLDLEIPPVGGCYGEAILDSGATPAPGAYTLTVGDLALAVRVLPQRGGLDAPARPHVVIASGYGWRTLLPQDGAFVSPTNVRLSTVLAALASAAGEAYDAPAEVRMGPRYEWGAGTRARAVLADLVRRKAIATWRVDPRTGRTTFTSWPALPAADSHGRVVERDLSIGARYVALDDSVAAWLPGCSVQGVRVARTMISEHGGELRVTVRDS